ncbi:hyalin-like [Patiria miniata]|uniref:HYR domain-containing protein n=1 Tax=Patiria miniata TaxID=46514 RepID=A0A914A4Q0_PATMI|nr:hyalin-like [Patiria miniata]
MVPWTPDPTATDDDGTTPEVICFPAAGSSFPVDETTNIVCNASDVAGNEAICTFNVTVDQQAPVIDNCPSNVRTNNAMVTWTPDPTATDDDGTTPEVTCNPAAGSSFPVDATTNVVCNASDAAGNEAICTFNVTVDQQAPVIDNCPSNVRTNNAVVTWTPEPTATDDDGTNLEVKCIPAAGSSFPVDATTIVVCNSIDAAGNEAICTFNVAVDQQAPVINSCPLDVRTENATVTWTPDPTATDDDGTTPEVTCFPAAGRSFPVDVTSIVVCNASDAAGNEAECIFTVTVDPKVVVVSMAINETNGSDVPFIEAYNDITSPESRTLCLPVETAMLEALSPELASIVTAKCTAIYQGSIIVDVRLGFSPEANNSAPLGSAVQGVLQNVITEGTFGAGGGITYTINPELVIAQCLEGIFILSPYFSVIHGNSTMYLNGIHALRRGPVIVFFVLLNTAESITCPTDYCQNGGECVKEGAVPRVQFSCNCSAGFTGDVCQTSIKGTPLAAILIPVIALVCLLVIIGVCTMTKAGYRHSKQPSAPPELNPMEYDTGERLYRPYHGRSNRRFTFKDST